MANGYVSQVQLPNNETYNIRDKELIPRLKATVGHSNINLFNEKYRQGSAGTLTNTTAVTSKTIIPTAIGQKHIFHNFNQDYAYVIYGLNSAGVSELLRGKNVSTSNRLYDSGYIRQFKYVYENNISDLVAYIIMIRKPQTSGGSNWINITPDSIDQNIIMVTEYPVTSDTFVPYQEPTDSLIETKARAYLNSTVGHPSKNLLDMTKYTTAGGTSNIQINEDTGSLSFTGTGLWRSLSYFENDNLGLKPNDTTYILTCINNLANSSPGRLAIRRRDTNVIVYSADLSTTGKKELKFTASSETFPNGWYISILATGATSATGSADISNLMLREASIADDTFEPYQEPTDSLIEIKTRAYLNSTVGHACKNLLNLKNLSSATRNGVTWTVDPVAGTITANGTATALSQYWDVRFTLSEGNYYFSGCPSGGDPSTYDVYTWDYTTNSRPKEWDGSTNAPSDFDGTKKQFQVVNNHEYGLTCRVEPGVTVNNLVFKPMVWDGSIADDSFEPYQEPTDSLIETKARAYLNSTVGHACKNLLDMTKYTTQGGISNIQINETTGSLSYTGTGTHVTVSFYAADLGVEMYGKTYTVSCINNLASTTDGRLAIRKANTNQIVTRVGFGSTGKKSITFTPDVETFPNGWYISVMATGSTSTTGKIDISNLMLREASIADDTFEPYQEPTDSLIEIKTRAYLNSTVGHACKNLLKITADSQTINGVTFTVDKTAGTITVNGQVSSSATMAQLDIVSRRDVDSSLNGLILTEPASKTIPNYGFRTAITYYNSSGTYISEQVINSGNPNPVVVSVPSNAYTYKVYVRATTSAGTLNNLVIKPMFREASISDDTFEPYVTPTDEAKQDKPVVLYDAGESSVGVHSVTGLSNLTQYEELHITLFAPYDNNVGFTHTVIYPNISPNATNNPVSMFDCWIVQRENDLSKIIRVTLYISVSENRVKISGEFDENEEFIDIPSNHYVYIKRIVGIP